jgi:hypothetical protein
MGCKKQEQERRILWSSVPRLIVQEICMFHKWTGYELHHQPAEVRQCKKNRYEDSKHLFLQNLLECVQGDIAAERNCSSLWIQKYYRAGRRQGVGTWEIDGIMPVGRSPWETLRNFFGRKFEEPPRTSRSLQNHLLTGPWPRAASVESIVPKRKWLTGGSAQLGGQSNHLNQKFGVFGNELSTVSYKL